MSNEEKRNSGVQIGTLGGCLIEGDSEQKARERKIKRRALAISIALQSLVIVALVVTPLLAKPEHLAFNIVTPTPIYQAVPNRSVRGVRPAAPQIHRVCFDCVTHISSKPITIDADPMEPAAPEAPNIGAVPVPGLDGGTRIFDGHKGPTAPGNGDQDKKKRISVGGAVQQAMLVHRVEPAYPSLAKTLHRSGQVHIRALIAVDGNIESLQVIDGDPLLVKSALDAVGQWRYRPTTLNVSPVEVETIITVIYTLNQ